MEEDGPTPPWKQARTEPEAPVQDDIKRGGWMKKAQELRDAVLANDKTLAYELALSYLKPEDRKRYC